MKCLNVMEGVMEFAVYEGAMNYLRGPLYCEVEFSPSMDIVDQIPEEDIDKDNCEK